MKKQIYTLMALTGLLLSCAKEIQDVAPEMTQEQQTLMTKLVGGTQGELVPGSVLVKMSEDAAVRLNAGDKGMFAGIEGISVIPALPVQPKNMDVARKYGLHRWFTVEFDRQMPHEKMAAGLASIGKVIN